MLGDFGNRGYRLVNLAAGLSGGRAYPAAYALGFGASGLTFYDDNVVEFFWEALVGVATGYVALRFEELVQTIGRCHATAQHTAEFGTTEAGQVGRSRAYTLAA